MKKERIKIKVADLTTNKGQLGWLPANPRQWTQEDLEKTKNSLTTDPDFIEERPILVLQDGKKWVAFAGNLRTTAAKELGWKETEVVHYTPETEDDKLTIKRRAMLDNGAFGAWDFDALANEWDDLPLTDWGVPAWKTEEEQEESPQQVEEDDFNEETDAVETRCKAGDIWQLGEHRLMCGDSSDPQMVASLMGGIEFDLLMTDPPYGIGADKMTMGTGKQTYERGEWDSSCPNILPMLGYAKEACIWGGNYFADILPVTNDWLCWYKNNDGLSFSEFELAWTNFGRNCRHITHHWGNEKKLHITMKPVEVIAWAIRQTKEDSNTILDLFGGSGTTIIAAEQLGRVCYTMEINPHFCDVIIARWEKLTGRKAEKIN